jgi:phospholipase C
MLPAASLLHAQALTPIKYVVVIFDENNSFDHYFGAYPKAANPQGQPPFIAAAGTPAVNGLSGALLERNPNGVNPFRLDRTQNVTCDNDNHYTDEQKATDSGMFDKQRLLNVPWGYEAAR